MTLAKAVVTGIVYRAPEKRFTSNDVAVTSFVIDIGEREESLIRVISKRTSLDSILSDISKGEKILVEGRLQTANAKMEDGSERKIFEIEASSIEKMSGGSSSPSASNGEIVNFGEVELEEELIDEEEIPF